MLSSRSAEEQASTLPGFAFSSGIGTALRGRSEDRELRDERGELLLAHLGTACPQEQPSTTRGPRHMHLMGTKAFFS